MAKPKGKGKHTCPELAGAQNLTPDNLAKVRAKPTGDESEFMSKTLPILKRTMQKNRRDYSGKWTEDELWAEIVDFFEYTQEHDLEPSPPMLQLWLCTNRETIGKWRKGNDFKSDILNYAFQLMEMRYFGKLDKHSVSNIFKLKSCYGYVETSKVEVSNTSTLDAKEVEEQIKKMGLDR